MRVSTYRLLVALAAGAGPIVLPAALAQPVAGREASQAAPGGVAGHDWHEVTRRFGGVKADTRPSRDATMKFSVSTEVREVLVQGGQKVKAGELLVRARDADLQAAIEQQQLVAGSDLEIRNAEAARDLAAFKLEQLRESGTYSPRELKEAELNLESATIQVDVAKMRKEVEGFRLKSYQGQAERTRLEAPFDGEVEEVFVEVGQGVNEQAPAVRLVNIDRLWLDPYPSIDQTIRLGLAAGSPAWVLVQHPDGPRLVRGRVLYVSPVADSVSQNRRVRVEIENPEHWPAGMQALVRFEAPTGEWEAAARIAPPADREREGGQ